MPGWAEILIGLGVAAFAIYLLYFLVALVFIGKVAREVTRVTRKDVRAAEIRRKTIV